jgi:hypothetical protein
MEKVAERAIAANQVLSFECIPYPFDYSAKPPALTGPAVARL